MAKYYSVFSQTLPEAYKSLLENELHSDVTFKVGKHQKPIKAHRLILSARSEVFERMLYGGFRESWEDPVLADVEPATFHAILRFCYYDCLDIDKEFGFLTLCAAKKYMLPTLESAARKVVGEKQDQVNVLDHYRYAHATNDHGLMEYCHEFMNKHMDSGFIWDLYSYAISTGDYHIRNICQNFFMTDMRDSLQTKRFLKISQEVLLSFLKINSIFDEKEVFYAKVINNKLTCLRKYQNHFGIRVSEINLFRACNDWSEAQCQRLGMKSEGVNKRRVLGDCVYCIRFGALLPIDLCCTVYPTGILSQEEIQQISMDVFRSEYTAKQLKESLFLQTPRNFIVRFGNITNIPMEMIAHARILLTKIWFLDKGRYKVTIKDEQLQQSQVTESISKCNSHVWYSKSAQTYYMLSSIQIQPFVMQAKGSYSVMIEPLDIPTRIKAPMHKGLVHVCKVPSFEKLIYAQHDMNVGKWKYAATVSLV